MATAGDRRLAATFVILFVAALLLLFLGQVTEILFLLFLAALLAVLVSAITDVLCRRLHVPRPLGLTLALVGIMAAVTGIGALVLPPVIAQAEALIRSVPEQAAQLEGTLSRLAERYPFLRGTRLGTEGGALHALFDDATDFVRGSLLPYLTAGGKLAVELVSVLAMAIYLARNPQEYRAGLVSLVPPKYRQLGRTIMTDLAETLRTWIGAQLLAMLVLAVLTAIGLWLLRVPYALAFGVFAGVVAIVPFFGTIVSTALPALFVLPNGVLHALAVLLLGVVVHVFEANVVQPLIFEERVSLPPVLTILSVLIMASLLGVLGLIVAVPTLASVMVILRHVLYGQIYREQSLERVPSAVLIGAATGERKAIVVES